MKYKVRNVLDDQYEVINYVYDVEYEDQEVVHEGSIESCAAFIKLSEDGRFRFSQR